MMRYSGWDLYAKGLEQSRETMIMTIGGHIGYRRRKVKLTIRELADRSGISSTLLFNMKSSKTEPNLSSLEKLAKAFGELK